MMTCKTCGKPWTSFNPTNFGPTGDLCFECHEKQKGERPQTVRPAMSAILIDKIRNEPVSDK